MMKLQMIGCSHHDEAVEFRERIALAGDGLAAALRGFRDRFPQCELVMLSTCNRVEMYATADERHAPAADDVRDFLADQAHVDAAEVRDHTRYRTGRDAVEHLFTVAASLDSMVVGESQILSQVKAAYDVACQQETAGPMTHGLFQAANRVAKRVQTETSIARRRVSVPSVAVGEVVPEVFDTLRGKTVVVCGSGEMGTETLRYLKNAGADNIVVVGRNYERAAGVAEQFGGRAERWESLAACVTAADVLVGATSATEPILDAATFAVHHPKRGGRTLLILDLAVPRDVEPAVGDFDGVYLYSIDDLQTACERNRRKREKEWPKAKAIIADETDAFMRSIQNQQTGPVIARLRRTAADVRDEELRRLSNKLSLSDDDPTRKEIEKSLDRLIGKLLHPPLASIRDDAADGHTRGLLEAVKHLFNLGDED